MKVGKNILKIREKNKITQDEMAEKYFVTRQTISNWENGKSYPDLETLVKISNDYNISLDKLLKEDDDMVKDISKKQKGYKKITTYKVLLAFFSVLCIGLVLHPLVNYILFKIYKGTFVYSFNFVVYSIILAIIALVLVLLPIKDKIKKVGFVFIGIAMLITSFGSFYEIMYDGVVDLKDFNIMGDVKIVGDREVRGNIFANHKWNLFVYYPEGATSLELHIRNGRTTKRGIYLEDEKGNRYILDYEIDANGKYSYNMRDIK